MFNLDKTQLIAAIGFIVVLLSIPLSFTLVKSSQVFRSRASEGESSQTVKISTSSATQNRNVPSTSPLSDLEKSVNESVPSAPTPTPAGNLNTAFGPTLNVKISLEGRPAVNQTAKVFVGIAAGAPQVKPTYTLTFTVDFPASGVFNGLSLAGLNPGSSYTAYVKGPAQIDTAVSFSMSPTETNLNNGQAVELLSGDLNEDNTINSADYSIAKDLYGTTSASSNWNSRADLNSDGTVNNLDIVYINRNMGKTGSSGVWYSPPPVSTSSATPATGSAAPPTDGYEYPKGSSNQGGYWFWMPAP